MTDDGLRLWTFGPRNGDERPVYFGRNDDPMTLVVLMPTYAAEHVVGRHNSEVEVARYKAREARETRPAIGNLEEFATRVFAAAIRELLRDARPRWWRRVTARASTRGDKPVYEGTR